MFFFGHLGAGSRLASPFSKGLPRGLLLLGTLLPDLIDKPLFYGLLFLRGLEETSQASFLVPAQAWVAGAAAVASRLLPAGADWSVLTAKNSSRCVTFA